MYFLVLFHLPAPPSLLPQPVLNSENRNNASSLFPPKAVKTATCHCFRQIRQFFTDMVCYISINPIFILPLTTTSPQESLIRLTIWLVYLEQSRVPFWLLSAQCTEVGFYFKLCFYPVKHFEKGALWILHYPFKEKNKNFGQDSGLLVRN